MLGLVKDTSLQFRVAEYIPIIKNDNGTYTDNYSDRKVIRFREIREEVINHYQPLQRKVHSKKALVIGTKNINKYKINDKIKIRGELSGRENKDLWRIKSITKMQYESESLSLALLKINPSTEFMLELE